ncbi:hypothetical protein Pcinc_022603 [Petrolisthes cinctipes]|uniref:C2H2-type domain-containing protein n=1 Tax=Petrolisthes cinctipes TaxID=88211 RepID=A0AAE1FFA6_PETCI|nr:hypothetical protein Pcinc_022603 [Petrolisthes cinctipes]
MVDTGRSIGGLVGWNGLRERKANPIVGSNFLSLQRLLPVHPPHPHPPSLAPPQRYAMDNKFRCCWCGKLSTTRYDYDKHLRTHTGEKPFACSQCSFRTGDRSSLSKHVRRHHSQLRQQLLQQQQQQQPSDLTGANFPQN